MRFFYFLGGKLMEFENTSVETQEVAEPVESVETPEVAEPVETAKETTSSGKTEADAAFAAQRRKLQEAERKIAEMEAKEQAREQAIKKLTGSDSGYIDAIAENIGADPSDVLATFDAEEEIVRQNNYIKQLEQEVAEIHAEKQFQEDLAVIQKIDPSIEKLFDLGDTFLALREKGVDAESAYWAAKAKKDATQMRAPKAPGKANAEQPEKDYFSEAEVDAMTPEQQRANADKILKSMKHW